GGGTLWQPRSAPGEADVNARSPQQPRPCLRAELMDGRLGKRQAVGHLSAGALWRDHGLVFCTRIGTPLGAGNVHRSLRSITKVPRLGNAGLPTSYPPRLSDPGDHGVSIEAIADRLGHKNSMGTARVYRDHWLPFGSAGR